MNNFDYKYDIYDLQFPSPPILNQEIKAGVNFDLLRDIRSGIIQLIDFLSNQNKFNSEIEILSKFCYKFTNQWRREKSLQFLKQIITTLEKIRRMKLVQTLEVYKDLVPSRFSVLADKELYLPTASVNVFMLGKLLTALILVDKAVKFCVLGGIEIQKQMELKLFLSYMTFALSLTSTIKKNFEALKNEIFILYENILKCFVLIYPSIQIDFPKNIHIWYLKLHESADEKRKTNQSIEDDFNTMNDQKLTESMELCSRLGSKNQFNSKILKDKKKILVKSVKTFLKRNSITDLSDDKLVKRKNELHEREQPNFSQPSCIIDYASLKINDYLLANKNANLEVTGKTTVNAINPATSNHFLDSNNFPAPNMEPVSSSFIFCEKEANRLMKKCACQSNCLKVEKLFLKFLKLQQGRQFNGQLIALRKFKLIKINGERLENRKKFHKKALKIVKDFVTENYLLKQSLL